MLYICIFSNKFDLNQAIRDLIVASLLRLPSLAKPAGKMILA